MQIMVKGIDNESILYLLFLIILTTWVSKCKKDGSQT